MPKPSKKSIAEIALKRYKYVSEYWAPQRKREKEDLEFQVAELQWDDKARAERQGNLDGVIPTPARPMISISKLNQPIQLVKNQQRQAKLGINVHPKSPDATPETAQEIQGIYRAIEQESGADNVRGWAFDRAIKAGLGYYRVNTDWDNEGGHPFDQVIRIERIRYQHAVYWDPSGQRADYSDSEYCFVCGFEPLDKARALWPEADLPDAQGEALAFESMTQLTPDWVRRGDDAAGNAILVAEYWYKVHEKQTWVDLDGLPDALVSLLPPEDQERGAVIEELLAPEIKAEIPKDARRRPHDVTKVMFCKLAPGGNSEEPLQHLEGPAEWNGQWIPIITVYGEELQPFDERTIYQGIIRPNRDAQKGYNFMASSLMERVSLEPKAPYLIDPKQIEEYQAWWDAANRRNLPYLPYHRFIGGQDYGLPQRSEIDMSGSSLAVMGLQQFNDFLQAGTFAYDPSLGQAQPQRSGKAIIAEQQQFEMSSGGFLYNMADVSMAYEARVVLDLIPHIYDRPGRIARSMDEEGKSSAIMLNAPFVMDPNTGQPRFAGNGAPPQAKTREVNLSEGVYSVTVTVGKSFQSQRQEGGQVIGEILQTRPELLPVLGPLWAKFQDWPGSQDFMKLLLKMRAMSYPGLDDEEDVGPEQLAAQNYALKQQLQQAQQQMQEMGQAMQAKQLEQEGKLQTAQMDSQTKLQTAQMDNETRVIIAAMQQELEQVKALLGLRVEREKAKAQVEGKLAEAAITEAFKPPEFTGSAERPLPKTERF